MLINITYLTVLKIKNILKTDDAKEKKKFNYKIEQKWNKEMWLWKMKHKVKNENQCIHIVSFIITILSMMIFYVYTYFHASSIYKWQYLKTWKLVIQIFKAFCIWFVTLWKINLEIIFFLQYITLLWSCITTFERPW